jgi:hypothetical protein
MPPRIQIHFLFPDGSPSESGSIEWSALSPKWLAICGELLSHFGPVFHHKMGAELSAFDIQLGGPVGQLLAQGHCAFHFAISLGAANGQDKATVAHFEHLYAAACNSAGYPPLPACTEAIRSSVVEPTLLLFDPCDPQIDQDDRAVAVELTFHLAGAYIRWCEPATPSHTD